MTDYYDTYFYIMEEAVLCNIDSCTVDDYLKQFPESEREMKYFEYIVSNYIKFMFIGAAKKEGKDYAKELFSMDVDVRLDESVKQIYDESYYRELVEEAVWMREDPETVHFDITKTDLYFGSLDFDEMESEVFSFTDDSVIDGYMEGIEGTENRRLEYINSIIDSFLKEMVLRDYDKVFRKGAYVDNDVFELIDETFLYMPNPSHILLDIYPLEWVDKEFPAS